MKFAPKQFRLLLIGVLAISAAIFLATAVLGINLLSRKSDELVNLKLKDKVLESQQIGLEAAKKQVEQYSYFNDIVKTVFPTDKDQAKAVLNINQFAKEAEFKLGRIEFPQSTLGSSASSGSSGSAISQAKPVEGIKGLYSLQLTITPDTSTYVPSNQVATYPKFIKFLKSIERDRRTAQITQVSINQRTEQNLPPESIDFTLVINIFLRP
jgi:hypothetical protein